MVNIEKITKDITELNKIRRRCLRECDDINNHTFTTYQENYYKKTKEIQDYLSKLDSIELIGQPIYKLDDKNIVYIHAGKRFYQVCVFDDSKIEFHEIPQEVLGLDEVLENYEDERVFLFFKYNDENYKFLNVSKKEYEEKGEFLF